MKTYNVILVDKIDVNRINQIKNLTDKFYHRGLDIAEMHVIFAVEKNSEIIAFSGLACYHGYWCLRLCVVHPKYRGLGLQKFLIQKRIDFLKTKKAKHVNVWIKPENTYSLNNCIDMGFKFTTEKGKIFRGAKHFKLRKYL